MTWRYKNPWHNPENRYSGPAYYETDKRPKQHLDYFIFKIHRMRYDLVKDGVCVRQFAGPNGAIRFLNEYNK